MDVINNFGLYLKDFVDNNKVKDANELIKRIASYLDENINSNTLNFLISKVFDDSFNLNKFLFKICDNKNWKTVLASGLDLITNFLNSFYERLRSYVPQIFITCVSISLSKADAFQKKRSLSVLCIILNDGCDITHDDVQDIYNKFSNFARVHQSTTSIEVQKKVLEMLGIIAKKYPFLIQNPAELINMYMNHLLRQSVNVDKRDKNVLSGCINGLSDILEEFPIDTPTRNKLYDIIRKFLTSKNFNFDIRDVLKFLTKHCTLFKENMYNDSPQLWHNLFQDWLSENRENSKAGYDMLYIFYTEIADILNSKNGEKDQAIFQYFYDYFLQTMKDKTAQIMKVRLAIRGFGIFSGPCEAHLTKENLLQMYITIMNRMEQDYFVQEVPTMEQLEYLPDYIHCFSSILHQIGEYTFDQIDSLQQISVLLIKTFPRYSPIYYNSLFDSMILSMCYLYEYNPRYLDNYLQRIIYQGVLWTCSHRTTFDVDFEKDENDYNKTTTYKNYLPLWKLLLNSTHRISNKCADISIETRKSVVNSVYDELVKTLLLLVNKLNLSTKSQYDKDTPVVDPQLAYKAEKIDDFVIFINVVEFYTELLSYNMNDLFRKWIKMYTNHIVQKSTKFPLVSGFYKLLAVGIQISDRLDYFSESELEKESKKVCYQTLRSFLEDVIYKVQDFKDDLQVSCLQLILTIPVSFVGHFLPHMNSIFHMAFAVGRGYLKLAETAVDSLEKWYKEISLEDLKPLFESVLPCLDPFLRNKGYSGDPDIKLSFLQGRKPKQSKTKRKIFVERDSELTVLQHKILMFIGQLNSELCMHMVESNAQVESVTWEKEPYLKFTVPYSELKPNIYLDKLVPRVLELALSSGDQKTRITACELLHAIVIFMLGTSRQMSVTKSDQLSKLFEKLILPLIQLGCDSNDVIRQLFCPLVFQMVHWYSSPVQLMSSETAILIDTLMECISHPNDTGVRDLSGKCIKEFVTWSIKQNNQMDRDDGRTDFSCNIHALVRKLCLYAVHPNPSKRLGAALAFNNLYTHLREEESMIETYWFEIFYSMLTNLSLNDSKYNRHSNNQQIVSALNHLERVFREKSLLFNRTSQIRRYPSAIEGSLLHNIVFWLLQQTGSKNTFYRRKCISLFCSLAAYVEGCGTVKDFIAKYIEKNETKTKWFVNVYETNGIEKLPTLRYYDGVGTFEILINWLQHFLRCLDAYTFLLNYKIITYCNIINDSKLQTSFDHFIEFISASKLDYALQLFNQCEEAITILPNETEIFNDIKFQVAIGIFDYLSAAVDKCTAWCDALNLINLWKFFCNCVFQPQIFGLDSSSRENFDILFNKITILFNKFIKKLPEAHLNKFCDEIVIYFNKIYDQNLSVNSSNISLIQRQLLKGWLLLQNCDLKNKINIKNELFSDVISNIFNNLVKESGDKKLSVILHSTIKEYSELQLQLAFKCNNQVTLLCNYLANSEQIKHPETYTIMTHGEYFMNTFKDIIMEYISMHFNEVIRSISSMWKGFNDCNSIVVIINILKYSTENQAIKNKLKDTDVIDIIMTYCSSVFNFSEISLKDRNFQIEFMAHVISFYKRTYVIGDKYPFFKEWFVNQLNYYPTDVPAKNLLQFKSNILFFLCGVTGPDDDEDEVLQSVLTAFINNILNLPPGQLEKTDYVVLFKKLLDYFLMSKSRIVLQIILHLFEKIEYNEIETIDKTLQIYSTKITPEQQLKTVCAVYDICCNQNYNQFSRHKMSKIFLITLLRVCTYNVFEDFFVTNIKAVINNLKLQLEKDGNDCDTLVNKCISLMLIEVLFARIDITGFTNNSDAITKAAIAAFDGKIKPENGLPIGLMSIIDAIRKTNLSFEDSDLKELYRLYHCNAFNALVSLISNIKKSPKDIIHYCYIFRENIKTNTIIWQNIVNCAKKIVIPQDFDMIPSRRKVFVNIRNEKQQILEEQPIRYIESQNLFNSTLSEDISKFDFSNTLVRSFDQSQETNRNPNKDNCISTIEIESVDINCHECMATICGLIRHIVDNGISPLPEDKTDLKLPAWLECIRMVMMDSNTQLNVKIFFARIIHNTKSIFKYYAKNFFEPIVKFIVDECTGDSINYFVADMVEMLLFWSDHMSFEDLKSPITQLMSYLIDKAHNDRRDMLKYNIEIIKTAIEIWKTAITEIPHDLLLNKISGKSKEKLVGIHLISVCLLNDFIPWSDNNRNDFIQSLLTIVQKEHIKAIYKPAAEVLGLILYKMSVDSESTKKFQVLSDQVENMFKNNFKGIAKDKSDSTDKLFHCLEQIQIHYPSIIDKFMRIISGKLFSQTDSSLISICLKNILRHFDQAECNILSSKDLIGYLKNDNNEVRLLTLQIVDKYIPELKKNLLLPLLNAVCEQKTDQNVMIRCAVYDVLITIYNKYVGETDAESREITKISKAVLLSAMVDSDLHLQEKIQNFWCNEKYQTLKLAERFERSLTDLYSPETELYYLGYVNYFLLEACKNTSEYNKLMFEHALSDCKFDEYELLINWRAQHASMAPMFANTNTMNFGNLQNAVPQFLGVRASTSAKLFLPTPSTSLDLSTSLSTTSSFIFEGAANILANLRQDTANQTNVISDTKSDKLRSRRFLKDQYKISMGFAKFEVEKKTKQVEQKRDRVKRKEANIVMYRQYRKGELPDIQIPNSAIIKPLQILARRDGVLGRQLYSMLFDGLINEMDNSDRFIENFNNGIVSIFNQTYAYVPVMIGAFLDVSFENNKKKNIRKMLIDPDTLSTVCKNSGLLPVGCLLLEEYINSYEDVPRASKRKCGDNDDDNINHWVKLADMYKELDEWDAVIGIFSSKHMSCSEQVSQAIYSEANGLCREALNYYKDLISVETNYSRKDFYYESYFKCFAYLSEWENISQNTRNLSEENLWDGDWNQEKMLPWYMTSEVCLTLNGSKITSIFANLNEWMKSNEKAEYLKDRFSDELAILSLYQNDVNAAKHYTENCFSKFLDDWSQQNPLFSKTRANKLLHFQKIVDLNKYLTFKGERFQEMINYWERNLNLTSFSVNDSEIRTLYRQLLLKTLSKKLESQEDEAEEYKIQISNLALTLDLNLINDSLNKNNYFIARKYFKKNGKHAESGELKIDNFKLSIAMGKIGALVAEVQPDKDKCKTLIKSWSALESTSKKYTNKYTDLQIECSQQIYKITQNISNILQQSNDLLKTYRNELSSLIKNVTSVTDIQRYSFNKLLNAIDLGENSMDHSENVNIQQSLIDTYLSLIFFAQEQESSDTKSDSYNEYVVKYILRAMKLGSKDARQLFPCLLQISDIGNSLLITFKKESEEVPTWMFLLWIPQLLATLNSPCISATADILERIATHYPQAIMYAYQLTKEKCDMNYKNNIFQSLTKKLDSLLSTDLVDRFLLELSCICLPELYFNYYLERIVRHVNDYDKLKEEIGHFKQDFLQKCSSSKPFHNIKTALKNLENKINGTKNLQELKNYILKLIGDNSILSKKTQAKKYPKLKNCSPWLANFKASDWSMELEIPGQYTGNRKPLIQYHAKISSFNSKISMLTSLRRPFKIAIFGNDSKEYPFLIKFGEDLRQDQRIQQLFSLANNILNSDQQCQQRNLRIEQYEVIPLKSSLGLIKMVDSKSLGKFIYSAADDEKQCAQFRNVRNDYEKWIKKASNKDFERDAMYYATACIKYSKMDTITSFRKLSHSIPADIVSKAFWQISKDAESFTYLRHQFITSYSTMCIAHWLFGIGDRNLENCMIILNTGRAIGIDFGFAFGASTQHLPIPELFPFRLTPHILHLMEPLKETGFIEQTMIHCLRALRKQKQILLSTMSVFIAEPSVDWLEFAKTQNTEDSDSNSVDWYPKQKLLLARKKFDGANPMMITLTELKNGRLSDNSHVLNAYENVLKGDENNIRSKMEEENLTEEQQVQCLLDQATDYNILGRMFAGLELWM